MALSDSRVDELLDQLTQLSDDDFAAWVAEQPDEKELAAMLLTLIVNPDPAAPPPDA